MLITTSRLTLRPVEPGDWRAIQSIWETEARSPYARYDRPKDLSDAAARAWAERWAAHRDDPGHRFFAACLEGAMIGYIAFNRREGGQYEIGYCFHAAHHRRGYAKESLSALIAALSGCGIRRFVAGTALDNGPSVGLLRALGFRLTGTERVSFHRDAEGRDIFFEGGIFELEA